MMVTLKVLIPEDAEELLRLQHQLDQEPKFMLLEPDEWQSNLRQVKEMIESFNGLVIDGQWVDEYIMSKILIKEKRIEDQI